ncbi:MAG: phosphoenolpyruvate--protein phosphotransferase [Phycisphaerales bacterium]
MRTIKGIPVSSGVVIGVAYVLDEDFVHIPRRAIASSAADAEVARFNEARAAAIVQLAQLHAAAEKEMGPDSAKVFLFHVGALNDKKLLDTIHETIRTKRVNAEWAVSSALQKWIDLFRSKADPTFATKVSDIEDIRRRLLSLLLGERLDVLQETAENAVIIARDLTPTQTATFDRSKVLAFVTDLGGKTSHTAIFARALALPAIVGAQNATQTVHDGQSVIVDADRGSLILDPDEETLERYRHERERVEAYRLSLAELADQPALTADGVQIEIQGNIEFPAEVDSVLSHGGSGIGLYRTEFLYLTSRTIPSEKTHFDAYAQCIEKLAGKPLTIRTVDLGADKYTQERAQVPERNPFLGLRSIRYCLENLDMFKTQLRALLRASALGPCKIMFPLITSVSEFRKARMVLRDAMEDLEEEGLPFDKNIPVGMMVEVPSAAIQAAVFAREADFFSIGTNDLVQYTLAVDRTNERVASLYNPAHPAVTKLIRDVARAARRSDIPVSCCGEAAGEPEFAALLLGLGLRTLSVTASDIPPLKRLIRSLSIPQCERIAKKAISLDSESEASAYLRDRIQRLVPEAFDGRTAEPRG